jgi:hypothetical protein
MQGSQDKGGSQSNLWVNERGMVICGRLRTDQDAYVVKKWAISKEG